MTPRLDLNDIANILLENAVEDFHKTEKYRLLCEKHNQAVDNYESKLSEIEKESVDEYLDALTELQGAETEFVYRQGFKDCMLILKKLTVIM